MRRLVVVCALAGVVVLLTAVPAWAEPPFDVPGPVTDHAGVLSADGQERVEGAIARLRSEDRVSLYVVYVDSFDGADPQVWAFETVAQSRLGSDDVVFAVAVDDGRYGWSVDAFFPQSHAGMNTLLARHVLPKLSAGRYDDAAVTLAEVLGPASHGASVSVDARAPVEGRTGPFPRALGGWAGGGAGVVIRVLAAIAGIAAGLAAAQLVSRARRRRSHAPPAPQPASADPDGD